MMNYKTLVAASLMSMALTSAAYAQCTECAMYPDRDVLNNGAPTPASKMGLNTNGPMPSSKMGPVRPGGAAGRANTANSENSMKNARAEVRDHHPRRSAHKRVENNPAKQ
jgi:hypothetical protein